MQVYCNMEGDMALAPDFKTIQKAGCRWELRDGSGRPVKESPFAFSGAGPGTDWVVLPCDSSVRVRVSLFGGGSDLDSLGLVNLIVCIEENINTEFNMSVSIADEKAMSQKHSPFRSVDTLADYLFALLNEK